MLKRLELRNVGPAPELDIEFGKRLNLLTGDNGLGKSFLLDVGWWAMTRRWPAEVNPGIATGMPVLPAGPGEASIRFSFTGASTVENYISRYRPEEQSWMGRPGILRTPDWYSTPCRTVPSPSGIPRATIGASLVAGRCSIST